MEKQERKNDVYGNSVLHVTVNRLIIMLDMDLNEFAPNLPVRYKHGKTAEMLHASSQAVQKTIKAMGLFGRFKEQKMLILNDAQTDLQFVQTVLLQFNMMGIISNEVKARFDIKIDDINKNYQRLLCSLDKELGQLSDGTLSEEVHSNQKETLLS